MGQNGVVTESIRVEQRNWLHRLWRIPGVRYLVTGGFCFLVDAGILWVAHDLIGIDLAVATAAAFLLSFVVTYTLQKVVAFESDSRVTPSVVRYALLVIVNTIATTFIVWAVTAWGPPWIVGKIVAVIITTVWNYFAYRYWVFAPAKETPRNV